MKEALVSVIMPVYNAEKYVLEAIDSILKQTYENLELIIVDDCSADASMQVVGGVEDKRIKLLHNDRNRGIAYSRNIAIQASVGKYIAIMDDDDISLPERIEKQVVFMESHPEIDVLGGAVEAIDAEGNIIRKASEPFHHPEYIKVHFLFHCIFHNSEMMFRRNLIEEGNIRYCENCYGMEDFRFWIECSKIGRMTNLQDVILQHRYHEETETSRVKREEYSQRKEYYSELQKMSFRLSGFELTEEEYRILVKSFPEGNLAEMELKEARQLYAVMKKLVKQSEEKNMDFTNELSIYLKKQLQQMIVKCSNLWCE